MGEKTRIFSVVPFMWNLQAQDLGNLGMGYAKCIHITVYIHRKMSRRIVTQNVIPGRQALNCFSLFPFLFLLECFTPACFGMAGGESLGSRIRPARLCPLLTSELKTSYFNLCKCKCSHLQTRDNTSPHRVLRIFFFSEFWGLNEMVCVMPSAQSQHGVRG